MILNTGMALTGGLTFELASTATSTIEYLVVAGGGGGGSNGGGGGAGGFRTAPGFAVTTGTTYTTTIGTGGAAPGTGSGTYKSGANGTNSLLTPVISNSYSFNGSSQYLTVAASSALGLGTGDFTVEAWVYTTVSSGTQCVYDTRHTNGTTTGFYFGLYASNTLLFYTGGVITINAGTVPINTWTHIALVRVGNTFTIYLNGTSVGTATNSNNFTNTIVQIGSSSTVATSSANYYTGYLSNLRAAKGVAVYTGNFTVPTSPLTATQSAGTNISAITGVQTSLLTLQSATIVDNSTYALSITNIGSVAFSSSTPFTSSTITSTGGGGGGGADGANGNGSGSAGGSGGGGGWGLTNTVGGAGNTPSTTPVQGYAGGTGLSGSSSGGAGGGAGAVGGNASGTVGGTGGIGVQSSITGTATYYAGGGAGGGGGGSPQGGAGGGGYGGVGLGVVGGPGTANTGGGGGGGSGNSAFGGAGGSGIVIIRYSSDYLPASSTTGSPTITVTGGYRIYKWTSSGSITF